MIVGDRGILDADILTSLRQVKSCDLHPLLLCSIVSGALLENLNHKRPSIIFMINPNGKHKVLVLLRNWVELLVLLRNYSFFYCSDKAIIF